MRTYEEAINYVGGAKYAPADTTQAWAAQEHAQRLCLQAKAVYDWAVRHNVDLVLHGTALRKDFLLTSLLIADSPFWTPERVQEELPHIEVFAKKSKRTYTGRTAGRKNDFATVWFEGQDGTIQSEYTWGTIANALNTRKPLQF